MRRSVNETNCRRIGTISCVMSTQFYCISWNKCINKWQKITRKESALGPSQLSSAQSLIPFQNPDKFLDTGWQRPRGCLRLQVIFRKRAATYRALLPEMTYERLGILWLYATLCNTSQTSSLRKLETHENNGAISKIKMKNKSMNLNDTSRMLIWDMYHVNFLCEIFEY